MNLYRGYTVDEKYIQCYHTILLGKNSRQQTWCGHGSVHRQNVHRHFNKKFK